MATPVGKVLSVNVGSVREFECGGRPARSAIWNHLPSVRSPPEVSISPETTRRIARHTGDPIRWSTPTSRFPSHEFLAGGLELIRVELLRVKDKGFIS
jgi:hypothetical protein